MHSKQAASRPRLQVAGGSLQLLCPEAVLWRLLQAASWVQVLVLTLLLLVGQQPQSEGQAAGVQGCAAGQGQILLELHAVGHSGCPARLLRLPRSWKACVAGCQKQLHPHHQRGTGA